MVEVGMVDGKHVTLPLPEAAALEKKRAAEKATPSARQEEPISVRGARRCLDGTAGSGPCQPPGVPKVGPQ